MTAAGQPEPAEQEQLHSSVCSKAWACMTAHAVTSLLGPHAAAQQQLCETRGKLGSSRGLHRTSMFSEWTLAGRCKSNQASPCVFPRRVFETMQSCLCSGGFAQAPAGCWEARRAAS